MGRSVGDALGELAGAVGDVRDEMRAVRRHREREERRPSAVAPRRASAVAWAHYIQPGMLGRMFQRVVPDEFVTVGENAAEVRCPCGAVVEVPDGDFRECECGRFYLLHAGATRVYNPERPVGVPSEPSEGLSGADAGDRSQDRAAA